MKVHDCEQNTPLWRALRAGLPTASSFDKIMTPTGKRSSQQEKLKFRLLAERLIGHPLDDHKFTWAMERGSALERKAVEYYEFQRDVSTVAVGFVTDDGERYGASPDRFVDEDGCLEVKAPEIDAHMMYLMNEGAAYEDYRIQAQGQLWVTERKWVDFLSYHPDLPWSLVRVARDEPFIGALSKYVEMFCDDLDALCADAKERGWFRQDSVKEPALSVQQQLIADLKKSLVEVNSQ